MASFRINTEVVAMGKKLPFSHVWQLTVKVYAPSQPCCRILFCKLYFLNIRGLILKLLK